MSFDAIFVLIVLVTASVLLVTEFLRADLVALLVLAALGASRVLTPQETLSGFSRSAVITILAIFILTAGLQKTGVTSHLGKQLVRFGGSSGTGMLIVLMAAAAFLSLFMNNIAAGAVLLPVAVGVAREHKLSPSKLMMPLAFGTLLGGMATLLTTSNILASSILRDNNLPPFALLTFAPIGIPAVLVGIAYMVLVGRRLLPRRAPTDWTRLTQAGREHLSDIYELRERWFEAHVPDASQLVGKTLPETGLGQELGINVIAVIHNGKARLAPPPSTVLHAGDLLYLQARQEQLETLRALGLEVTARTPPAELGGENIRLFEIVPSPRATIIGKTLREIQFRDKYGLSVVAIWRAGHPRRVELGSMPLQGGDALLVLGTTQRAQILQNEPDFIVLSSAIEQEIRHHKAKWAAVIMVAALVVSASGVVQIAEAMLIGALAMVLVGALTMDEAYAAIDWRVIFLIAGMLPLGLALTKTGAAAYIGNGIVTMLGGFGPLVVLASILVATILLTQVMGGQAAIVILAPIAIAAAAQLHSNGYTFVLGAALASSMAFLTPLGHPINMLVMGPGGYKVTDYLRVGAVLTLLLFGLIMVLLPVLYGI